LLDTKILDEPQDDFYYARWHDTQKTIALQLFTVFSIIINNKHDVIKTHITLDWKRSNKQTNLIGNIIWETVDEMTVLQP
jgi:hypothetical protein